jgi:hypothetical protein
MHRRTPIPSPPVTDKVLPPAARTRSKVPEAEHSKGLSFNTPRAPRRVAARKTTEATNTVPMTKTGPPVGKKKLSAKIAKGVPVGGSASEKQGVEATG